MVSDEGRKLFLHRIQVGDPNFIYQWTNHMRHLKQKRVFLLAAIFFLPLEAGFLGGVCVENVSRFEEYLDLLHQYPDTLGPIGSATNGEIEIIQDIPQMEAIEIQTGRKVGVIAKDRYWIWLNDAVKFPKGTVGVYGRILWMKSFQGTPGVAVLPVLPDGRIALNLNHRHATRSWELELPRGCIEPHESPREAAAREVEEETGMKLGICISLGIMAPDTGLTNTLVPVFFAKVVDQHQASPEDSEAIKEIIAFSVSEIKRGLVEGFLSVKLNGHMQRIPLRDPFLTFALLQAEMRHLLPLEVPIPT